MDHNYVQVTDNNMTNQVILASHRPFLGNLIAHAQLCPAPSRTFICSHLRDRPIYRLTFCIATLKTIRSEINYSQAICSMGRKRVIDQEEILNAAEFVVVRDGAAHLTLDAVAEQAGISKASVIYDYKSKQALIQAVIERRVAHDKAFIQELTDGLGDMPSAVMRGLLLASANPPPDDARAVAVNLCSALAQDAQLRSGIQKEQAAKIAQVMETSASPAAPSLPTLRWKALKSSNISTFTAGRRGNAAGFCVKSTG